MLQWIVLGGFVLSCIPLLQPYVLLSLLLFLLYRFSPTKLLIGTRRPELDTGLILASLMLTVEDFLLLFGIFPEIFRSKVNFLLPFGLVILFAISWFSMNHVKKPSTLAIHESPLAAFCIMLGFVVMFFKPVLMWAYTAPYVIIVGGVLLCFCNLTWHAREIRKLFVQYDTILLSISGLLILHFTIMVLGGIVNLRPDELSLTFLGTLFLVFLPGYVWYTVFRIRAQGHDHLPDWPPWVTGIIFACIVVAFNAPMLAFTYSADIDHVRIVETGAHSSLILAGSVFTVVFLLGTVSDYARKLLMVGPFLSGLYFLGVYMYYAFTSTFLHVANAVLRTEGGYVVVPVMVLLALCMTVFSVTGYLSFLYEIWRE